MVIVEEHKYKYKITGTSRIEAYFEAREPECRQALGHVKAW